MVRSLALSNLSKAWRGPLTDRAQSAYESNNKSTGCNMAEYKFLLVCKRPGRNPLYPWLIHANHQKKYRHRNRTDGVFVGVRWIGCLVPHATGLECDHPLGGRRGSLQKKFILPCAVMNLIFSTAFTKSPCVGARMGQIC